MERTLSMVNRRARVKHDEQKRCGGKLWDREDAERLGDGARAGVFQLTEGRLFWKELELHVIDGDEESHSSEHAHIGKNAKVGMQAGHRDDDCKRVHCDPLIPTELTWDETSDLREIQAPRRGSNGHDRRDVEHRPPDAVTQLAASEQREATQETTQDKQRHELHQRARVKGGGQRPYCTDN